MLQLLLLLVTLGFATPVIAQGCGPQNPNCVVPDRPANDSTNSAANTRFVTNAVQNGRVGLTSNLVLWVNTTTGNDANTCTNATTDVCQTLQRAWNRLAWDYDLKGFTATILGLGTDVNGVNFTDGPPGSSAISIVIQSQTGNPDDLKVAVTGAGQSAFSMINGYANLTEVGLFHMTVSSTNGDCIRSEKGILRFGDIIIDTPGCAANAIYSKHQGQITQAGTLTVKGGGFSLFAVQTGGLLITESTPIGANDTTVTIANPITYSVATVNISNGWMYARDQAYVNPGNVTGPKFGQSDGFLDLDTTPNARFPGTIDNVSQITGNQFVFLGTTSGGVTMRNGSPIVPAYFFNLPVDAGTANHPLVSQGGGSNAMTWAGISGNTGTMATVATPLVAGECAAIDANGNLITSGGPCGGGTGSGTVNNGTQNQLAYYGTTGTTVSGNANHTVNAGAMQHGIAGSVQGSIILAGGTTGTTTVAVPASAGVYNFILPTAAGTSGQPLLSGGGGGAQTYGTLGVGAGGTGLTSGTSGGVLAFTGAGTIASSAALTQNRLVLGGGAGAAPTVLGSLGSTTTVLHGNAAGAPSFSAVSLGSDITGTLGVANGGTGLTTGTSGGVLAFTGAGTIASSAALTQNRIVLGGGAGAAPTVLGSLGTTTTLLHGNAAGAPSFGAVALGTDVSGTLTVPNGGTGAATFSAGLPLLGNGTSAFTSGTGINANILNSKTGNYTILNTDCGKTIQAGTGASGQFTVTLPAVAGFASDCSVLVVNGDTTRGKILSGFPSPIRNRLYPGQTVGVKIVNGAWRATQSPDRWVLSGNTSLFLDPAGSDNNDCLASGTTNACQTMQGVWDLMAKSFDLNNFVVTVTMAAGVYTSGLAANTMPPGACANSCIIFNGAAMTTVFIRVNTTTAIGVGGAGSTARQPSMTLTNVTINNAGGTCIQGDGGSMYIGNIQFGDGTGAKACAGPAIYARHQGAINLIGDLTFTGGAANSIDYMGFSQTMGALYVENHTVNISANVTCNVACWIAAGGQIWSGDLAFNLGGFTVTGQRYSANQHGVIISAGNVDPGGPNHFPGTAAGQQVLLGVYDVPGTPTAATGTGAGNCGTGPAPSVQSDSTDLRGTVTVGGGGVTECSITLTNFYANRPFCTVTSEASGATALTGFGYTVTSGTAVFPRVIRVQWTAGTPTNIQWQCIY